MVLDVLKRLLAEQFDMDPEEITEDTDLEMDLDTDSMDLVELCLACEDEFDISIDDSEFSAVRISGKTVGDLANYLESRMEE